MSFQSPFWIGLAAVLAALVVLLHLLARNRPRILVLPTARFIPDHPATAASIARRPTNLLLLLLRVLVIMLTGIAFARPISPPARRTAQLVLLDRSRLAPAPDASAQALLATAELVLPFDSGGRGSLSAALVSALRAAPEYAGRNDSIALAVVSPFAAEEWDEATLLVRRRWPGRIELYPVEPVQSAGAASTIELADNDPLSAPASLIGPTATRVVRGTATAADSAFASDGGTLVVWPRDLARAGWAAGPGDTIGGVMAGNDAVVAPFPRPALPGEGRILAVWADGLPAATTRPWGQGCISLVAIELPASGDIVLRPAMVGLVRELLAPCTGRFRGERLSDSLLDSLRGPAHLLPSNLLAKPEESRTPADPWWLLAAGLVFLAEPLVRRRGGGR
jgi:Aerotolerance regulator N-terminal